MRAELSAAREADNNTIALNLGVFDIVSDSVRNRIILIFLEMILS
jgi:hypothetical protein